MRKYICLTLSILLLVITTAVILLGFIVIEPSTINIILISLISVMGYVGSYVYYLGYKEW
jgi:hypothetical protein